MSTTKQTAHTLPDNYELLLGSDGQYHVWSKSGWRGSASRELCEFKDEDGYLYVRVTALNGLRFKRYIHRLVCALSNGEKPTPQHEARHLDGNRLNNAPDNLKWGTRKENAEDRERHGRTSRGTEHAECLDAKRKRLIAAAPELLAALEAVDARLHKGVVESQPNFMEQDCHRIIRAAIAAAQGNP